ncbi:MAG TPA: carbon-nitrogen hydrolase family protein [Burkholderiales bacterium]|nr:carbon-nitrogen hydrolase family protein [Burkholderiales bacterium]
MKICLIQMNSQHDKAANLRQAAELIDRACEHERPDMVVLPECFTFRGGTVALHKQAAEPCPGGEAYSMLQDRARRHGVVIHGGSLNECDGPDVYNTTLVFDRSGREIARYRKIHMFAITAPDGVRYDEGEIYRAGDDVVTYETDGVTVGCAICYDLRFPELFRKLVDAGARVIAMPAAFTLQTGKEHWEVLLRARAIESQCYILAAAQEGVYYDNGEALYTYGHSMVVEPWGTVVARRALGSGIVTTRLMASEVDSARQRIPLARHRRISIAV